MEIETIFSESKWKILTELSQGSLSPSELAKKTGTSLANISTQVRLLEALGFIDKKKLINRAKGEPRKIYSLKKEFAYMILGTKTVMGKKMYNVGEDSLYFFKVHMIQDKKAPQVLSKLYCNHENVLRNVISIGYLGIRGEELEILVICDEPGKLHFLNNKKIRWHGIEYSVKSHVHKFADFLKGVKEKNEYFTTILKRVFVITDKDHIITELKKGK